MLQIHDFSNNPTKNSHRLRNQIFATTLNHETVRLDDAEKSHATSSYSFTQYEMWPHHDGTTVTSVSPIKCPCIPYIPMALKTSPPFVLPYTTQHKNVRRLSQTLYNHFMALLMLMIHIAKHYFTNY